MIAQLALSLPFSFAERELKGQASLTAGFSDFFYVVHGVFEKRKAVGSFGMYFILDSFAAPSRMIGRIGEPLGMRHQAEDPSR